MQLRGPELGPGSTPIPVTDNHIIHKNVVFVNKNLWKTYVRPSFDYTYLRAGKQAAAAIRASQDPKIGPMNAAELMYFASRCGWQS